jgi:hypothetical protein
MPPALKPYLKKYRDRSIAPIENKPTYASPRAFSAPSKPSPIFFDVSIV